MYQHCTSQVVALVSVKLAHNINYDGPQDSGSCFSYFSVRSLYRSLGWPFPFTCHICTMDSSFVTFQFQMLQQLHWSLPPENEGYIFGIGFKNTSPILLCSYLQGLIHVPACSIFPILDSLFEIINTQHFYTSSTLQPSKCRAKDRKYHYPHVHK